MQKYFKTCNERANRGFLECSDRQLCHVRHYEDCRWLVILIAVAFDCLSIIITDYAHQNTIREYKHTTHANYMTIVANYFPFMSVSVFMKVLENGKQRYFNVDIKEPFDQLFSD